jgi:hypothetical protein
MSGGSVQRDCPEGQLGSEDPAGGLAVADLDPEMVQLLARLRGHADPIDALRRAAAMQSDRGEPARGCGGELLREAAPRPVVLSCVSCRKSSSPSMQ